MRAGLKPLYEKLGTVLTSIAPRNERARSWLDKMILRCLENSKQQLDKYTTAASIQTLNLEFDIVLLIQGDDDKQKRLYGEVERLLMEMQAAIPPPTGGRY